MGYKPLSGKYPDHQTFHDLLMGGDRLGPGNGVAESAHVVHKYRMWNGLELLELISPSQIRTDHFSYSIPRSEHVCAAPVVVSSPESARGCEKLRSPVRSLFTAGAYWLQAAWPR